MLKVKPLLSLLFSQGYDNFALTDINTTSACIDFIREAPKHHISPVVGVDFRNGINQCYVGIAQNNEGFFELNQFLSEHLHQNIDFPEDAPALKGVFFIYPYSNNKKRTLKSNERLGITPKDLAKFRFSSQEFDPKKLVAFPTGTFRNKKDHNAHRLLRAIDNNTLLSKLPKSEEGKESDRFLDKKTIETIYQDFAFLLRNAEGLLNQCSIHFEFGDQYPHKNKQTLTESEEEDKKLLRELCEKGMEYRYPNPSPEILTRLEKELSIISEKGFVSYFLINWKIIQYAIKNEYYYVGRGSGANSIVAYLLRITDVDPIELDLYFERFINLYRKNPPDFDIDFSWRDRDDITDYIFKQFPKATLLATYNTFKYKAVVRELGKVFGLPKHEIDKLSDETHNMNNLDHVSMLVLKYSKLIQGLPNHLSVHPSGIVISEKHIHHYTSTFIPPKGYPTTHFSMLEAEDVGLHKFDILSQRGLGKIKDALEIIKINHPQLPPIDIHDIQRFKEDEDIKSILRKGEAIGCFYVESPAMRMLLKKLKVDHYLGLVAASSIIRPGVAKSGMMREYILRFRHKERRKEAHQVMLDIMPDTYGIMVYQEDVIKVAHHFAGLTLAQADHLRRGMSGKFRSREEFQQIKNVFFENCKARKYKDQLTSEIWRQIESFAGYAFSKGHSASYAVESYQCLFLKAHFPLEYMVATINNFGGFYHTSIYIHEARMLGAEIHFPCINKSNLFTTIYGKKIYLGFILIDSIETKLIKRIMVDREEGAYSSLNDFINRTNASLEQTTLLIRAGAFGFTNRNKQELLWEAHFSLKKTIASVPVKTLFQRVEQKTFDLPPLVQSGNENAFDELELFGFSGTSPFSLIKKQPKLVVLACNLKKYLHKTITIQGYLVTRKRTTTSGNKNMFFGTFLDRKGDFFDTTHFPNVAARFPFRGTGVYSITGKVVEEFDFYSLEVDSMYKEDLIEDPRYAEN